MSGETNSGPHIVLAFQDYAPPFDAEKAVRRMLRIVPTNYSKSGKSGKSGTTKIGDSRNVFLALFQPVDLDFLFQWFEFHVTRDKFRFLFLG